MSAAAVGTPMVNMSLAMRRFYAARGMWIDAQPQGWLSTMLGPPVSSLPKCTLFYAGAEQIRELMRDIKENGPRGLGGQQIGQLLRRLREVLQKSGERISVAATTETPDTDLQLQPDEVPFEPLVVPFSGKARQAFIHHAWNCLTELVDFEQTAAYREGAES